MIRIERLYGRRSRNCTEEHRESRPVKTEKETMRIQRMSGCVKKPARCTTKIKRRVLRRQARKARAEHLVRKKKSKICR